MKGARWLLLAGVALSGCQCVDSAYDAYCLRHAGCDAGGAGGDAGTDAGVDAGPGAVPDAGTCDAGPFTPDGGAGYTVWCNAILDGTGAAHLFKGLARPSLEWSTTGDHLSLQDVQAMAGWGANVVRVPLTQDFWLPGAATYDPGYAAAVQQLVAWSHDAGMDVLLELHRSDRGDLTATPAQERMPDANSVAFWSQVAAAYKTDPKALFELYSDPHDVPWSVWLSGGPSGDGFQASGMQQLYDAIRAAGASNLVVVNGLDFGFDLSGVPQNRVQGYNIVYGTHPFDFPGKEPATWDGAFGFLTRTDAVMATEFGSLDCSTAYDAALLAYAGQHGMGWTAWAWYPGGCGFPALILDWSGTPSDAGVVIKAAL